ncbi:hypothetical protein SMICM304S_07821 [Streptomyces microflavus]
MDPQGSTVQRFPLVARFRPACLPLSKRVRALVDLADTAVTETDQGVASSVYNQAALIASDLGLPDLAREMCHEHAAAYLHACPLSAMSAIRCLEPVVNLARLQIRGGYADVGRQRLLDLYAAVEAGRPARFEGVAVPADLTAADKDRREVVAWLWRVLLADGTRTLTTEGRWTEALAHIEAHRGVGKRMLDGRQVAVLASLAEGDTAHASALLADTMPGETWEQTVTACLTVLSRRAAGQLADAQLADLATTYLDRQAEPGMTVFDIRLGLTVLDAVGPADLPAARRIVEDLHRRATEAEDGYAAYMQWTIELPYTTHRAPGRSTATGGERWPLRETAAIRVALRCGSQTSTSAGRAPPPGRAKAIRWRPGPPVQRWARRPSTRTSSGEPPGLFSTSSSMEAASVRTAKRTPAVVRASRARLADRVVSSRSRGIRSGSRPPPAPAQSPSGLQPVMPSKESRGSSGVSRFTGGRGGAGVASVDMGGHLPGPGGRVRIRGGAGPTRTPNVSA